MFYLSVPAEAKLTLGGESVIRLGYGSRYFSSYGWKLDLGGLLASQELRLDVEGEVVDGVAVTGHLDNTKGDIFQQLTVGISWKGLAAGAGNIPYIPYISSISDRKAMLMGLSVAYDSPQVSAYAIGGRSSGRRGSKTFTGSSAEESIVYLTGGPYMPSRSGTGLTGALEGLWNSSGAAEFDPDLDEGGMVFIASSPSGDLVEYMTLNSLGELVCSDINPSGTLIADAFIKDQTVDGLSGISGSYLVLRSQPRALVRFRLVELIARYNNLAGLSGDAALEYPYIAGSQADMDFLDGLLSGWVEFAAASKSTGEVRSRISAGLFSQGLLYPLGSREAEPETIKLEAVKADGSSVPFEMVPGGSWIPYASRGYLEIELPADFLTHYSSLKARYAYSISSGIYFLGSGILRGSVTARLDGKLLSEGKDYEVDYETGILLLYAIPGAGGEGRLDVDFEFEVQGSKAWLAAAGLSYRPSDAVELALEYKYASDAPYLKEDQAEVPRERSYESTLAAEARWQLSEWLTVKAGGYFIASTFPGDMAKKPNEPNTVTAIEPLVDNQGGTWWAFLSKDGVNVLSPYTSLWRKVTLPAALSGKEVLSASSSDGVWFFGTDSGIARLEADRSAYMDGFFDVVNAWKVAGTRQGMQHGTATALAVRGSTLFVGTPAGLIEGPTSLAGPWTLHRPTDEPGLPASGARWLAAGPGGVYVAGEEGISYYDSAVFTSISTASISSMKAAWMPGIAEALAATPEGIMAVNPSGAAIMPGSSASATMAAGFGDIVYSVDGHGLWALDALLGITIPIEAQPCLAAVATDGVAVFAAGRADDDYRIMLLKLAYPAGAADNIGPETHGISGKDPSRYLPLDPAENTVYAAGGQLGAELKMETISGALTVKAAGPVALPAFDTTSVGASLQLNLDWRPVSGIGVTFLETLTATGIWNTDPGSGKKLVNLLQLGFGWSGPININAFASYKTSAGLGTEVPPEHSAGGSLSLSYSGFGIRASGALSASYKAGGVLPQYASSGASASFFAQIGKFASFTASYYEPTPFGNLLMPSGTTRTIAASFRYSSNITTGSVAFTAKGSYRRDVRKLADSGEATVSASYSARRLAILGSSYLPRIEGSVSYLAPQGSESKITASLNHVAGISFGLVGAEVGASAKLAYMLESLRITSTGEAYLNANFGSVAWPVRPTLRLDMSYRAEGSPSSETTGSWGAGAKITLSSSKPVKNIAALGYSYLSPKGGTHSITASDAVSWALLNGAMGLGAGINASMNVKASDVSASSYKASLNVNLGYRIDKNWSLKASGEIGLGSSRFADPPKGIYGFEASVSLRF